MMILVCRNFKRIFCVYLDIFIIVIFKVFSSSWINLVQGGSNTLVFSLSFEGRCFKTCYLSITLRLDFVDFLKSILAQVACPWQEGVWIDAKRLADYLIGLEQLVHVDLYTIDDVLDLSITILLRQQGLKRTHLLVDLLCLST